MEISPGATPSLAEPAREQRGALAGRQPLLGLAFFLALGVLAAEWMQPQPEIPAAATLVLALLAVLVRRDLCAWLACGAAGATLHAAALSAPASRALEAAIGPVPRLARVIGVVSEEPKAKADSNWCRFTLAAESVAFGDGPALPCAAPVLVAWPAEKPPRYGDRVEFTSSLRPPAAPRNPGQFDYAAWLRRKGVRTEAWLRDLADGRILSSGHGWRTVEWSHEFRRWTSARLRHDLDNEPAAAAVIASMVLGTADEAADQLADAFRQTGTFHLFAVSGFNVAILALLVLGALQPFGLARGPWSPVVVVPVLVFYAMVTGLGASSVRATLMAAVLVSAAWSDRPARLANSLGAAALAILAWDPAQLFGAGFQLSFFVVLGLMLLADPIARPWRERGAPDPFIPRRLVSRTRRAWEWVRLAMIALLSASLAAWLASAPLMWWHFRTVTPSGLVANLFAIPLATVVLALGVLCLLGASLSLGWAALVNNANLLATKILLGGVQGLTGAPGGHFHLAPPWEQAAEAEVVAWDFEKSATVLLRAGGETWLLGAGHDSDYERGLRPCLHWRGLDRVEALVALTPNAAHLAASEEVLDDFRPATVVDTPLAARSPHRRDLHAELSTRKQGKALAWRGHALPLGNGTATARVLFPPAGWETRLGDDKGLVLRLETASGRRLLFLGDAGFAAETWLLKNEPDLRADVLVFGENGRDMSGTPDFVSAVNPRVIVRHERNRAFRRAPDEGEADRLAFRPPPGVIFLRTTDEGAVTLRVWSDRIEAKGFVSGRREHLTLGIREPLESPVRPSAETAPSTAPAPRGSPPQSAEETVPKRKARSAAKGE